MQKGNLSVHLLPRILYLVPIFHFPIPRSRFPVLVSSGNKTFQVHDSAFETSWILIDYAEPLSSEPQKDAENFANDGNVTRPVGNLETLTPVSFKTTKKITLYKYIYICYTVHSETNETKSSKVTLSRSE